MFFSKETLTVDEPSYLGFAHNLLHGFYSPPPPNIDLWHGPGYPLLIAPLVALNVPLICLRLLNALLLYFSVIFFYRIVQDRFGYKPALILAVIFGCYWLAFKGLPVIMTETFVFFLLMLITNVASWYFNSNKIIPAQLFLLSFLIAYLALTKIIFGYVLMIGLFIVLLGWIISRKKNYKKASLVFATALVFTLPYLIYTYSLTGRFFYWGNPGGSALYWMSNPVKGEYGDWFNVRLEPNQSIDGIVPGAKQRLEANHLEEMTLINKYVGVERDDLLKQKALNNITNHPFKYFQNWVANIGRLLFNYPYSYRKYGMGMYLNMIPNLFLVGAVFFYLPYTLSRWRQMPAFIKFLLLLVIIYFFLSTLVSAAIRMFYILFPVLATWLSYCMLERRSSNN